MQDFFAIDHERQGDAHRAGEGMVLQFARAEELLFVAQKFFRAGQKIQPEVGEADGAGVAPEETCAEFVFQFANHAANHLRGNGKMLRGVAEIERIGGDDEVFQGIQSVHNLIFRNGVFVNYSFF